MMEEQMARVDADIIDVEQQIATATIHRPKVETVMDTWGELLEGWDKMEEAIREEVLQAIVEEVVVTEKDRVRLRRLPIATVHGRFLALNAPLGARRGLEPLAYGL